MLHVLSEFNYEHSQACCEVFCMFLPMSLLLYLTIRQIVLLVVMNTVHLVFSIHESYWYVSTVGFVIRAHLTTAMRRLMVLNFGNVEEILLHAPW